MLGTIIGSQAFLNFQYLIALKIKIELYDFKSPYIIIFISHINRI